MDDDAVAGLGLTFAAASGVSSRAGCPDGERDGVGEVELVPGGRDIEVRFYHHKVRG